MATIGEAADNYKPANKTRNIAELPRVSIDLELVEDTFDFEKEGTVKKVTQEVIVIDGEKYRVPATVKQQLQVLREDNPSLKFFKVKKSGTTKEDTRYQVIPLIE